MWRLNWMKTYRVLRTFTWNGFNIVSRITEKLDKKYDPKQKVAHIMPWFLTRYIFQLPVKGLSCKNAFQHVTASPALFSAIIPHVISRTQESRSDPVLSFARWYLPSTLPVSEQRRQFMTCIGCHKLALGCTCRRALKWEKSLRGGAVG